MSRSFSRSSASALSLLAGLALLSGCSSHDSDREAGSVSRIVYAVRQHTVLSAEGVLTIDVAGGMGQVMDYERYVPGARLEVFDLRSGDRKRVPNIL